jgi:predicted nucleotidyltransferase
MNHARIDIPKRKLAEFCRTRHIAKLALFGYVLRDDFRVDSDVDVLVQFEPDHVPGFIALAEMEDELSALLGGRKVDLVTEKFLNHRIRRKVLEQSEVEYVQR